MKKVIIIVGVVLLVGASIGAYFLLQNTDDESTQNNQAAENSQESNDGGFAPLVTSDLSFEAIITTEQQEEVSEATISFDGKGRSEYVITQDGQTVRTIYTKNTYYTCNDSQGCFKFDLTQSAGTNIDPEDYQFTSEDAQDYAANATNQGTKPCDTGTCTVWVSNSYKNQGKTTVYVDTETNRIVKIESKYDGTTSTIDITYKPVTIKIPTNVQELPAGI